MRRRRTRRSAIRPNTNPASIDSIGKPGIGGFTTTVPTRVVPVIVVEIEVDVCVVVEVTVTVCVPAVIVVPTELVNVWIIVVDVAPVTVVVAVKNVLWPDITVATTMTVSDRVAVTLTVPVATIVLAALCDEVATALFTTVETWVVEAAVVVVVGLGMLVLVTVTKCGLNVILPIRLTVVSLSPNQILSLGPAAMPQGLLLVLGIANKLI